MAVIVEVGHPAKVLFDQRLTLVASLAAMLARVKRPQRPHLRPNAGQIAVVEGQDKSPAVGLADLEKTLVGIETIGGQPPMAG